MPKPEPMSDRTAWRIASRNGWWSAFGKKRGRNGKKPGPPVHDDLCAVTDENGRIRHEFTADGPNRLWLTDTTEHKIPPARGRSQNGHNEPRGNEPQVNRSHATELVDFTPGRAGVGKAPALKRSAKFCKGSRRLT